MRDNVAVQKAEPTVEFIGWQETVSGDVFPLFNIVDVKHPSYGSTLTETDLRELKLEIPSVPYLQRPMRPRERIVSSK